MHKIRNSISDGLTTTDTKSRCLRWMPGLVDVIGDQQTLKVPVTVRSPNIESALEVEFTLEVGVRSGICRF